MPVVRLTGWRAGHPPSVPPQSLSKTLAEEAGFDAREALNAVKRLMLGKPVDVYFDLGEHKAAKAFAIELERFGLKSQLYDDHWTWYGAKARPWFITYGLGGALCLSVLWLATNQFWPESVLSRVMTAALGIFVVSVLYLYPKRKEPRTDHSLRWEQNLRFWLSVVFPLSVFLVRGIFEEPTLAFVIVALGVGGVACAAIIRAVNRRN